MGACGMSLIICTECGRQISDKALACPGCGWQVNTVFGRHESNNENIQQTGSLQPCRSSDYKLGNDLHGSEITIQKSQKQICASSAAAPWGSAVIWILATITLFFPFIGIILGIYGICNKPKRTQGVFLILESIVVLVISFILGIFYGILGLLLL